MPSRRRAKKVLAFIKREFYDEYKPPRMINSRCDSFKAFAGPFIKAIEHVVYALPEFIKHTPVPERPAKIASLIRDGCRYVCTDFTSFEASFLPVFQAVCECALFRWCLSEYPEEANFICAVDAGENFMSTRQGSHATVRGHRMSGDMWTSLGNGFTNLMLMLYIAEKKGGEAVGFVEGDDGVFRNNFDLTPQDYEPLGFIMKIKYLDDPRKAAFCGMVCASENEIIRDPYHFLNGFAWTHSMVEAGQKVMSALLRAKSLSACYETPQCPIVGAMARVGLALTEGVAPRWVLDGYHEVPRDSFKVPAFAPAIGTRLLFEELYKIDVPTQIAIETAIQSLDMFRVSALLPTRFEMGAAAFDTAHYCARYLERG